MKKPQVPSKMAEVGIDRGTNDLTTDLPKLLGSVTEGDDLSGAHKGEVQRVEEEHHVLPWRGHTQERSQKCVCLGTCWPSLLGQQKHRVADLAPGASSVFTTL